MSSRTVSLTEVAHEMVRAAFKSLNSHPELEGIITWPQVEAALEPLINTIEGLRESNEQLQSLDGMQQREIERLKYGERR